MSKTKDLSKFTFTITSNEGERSLSLLKRILHYTQDVLWMTWQEIERSCTYGLYTLHGCLSAWALYWENHWNVCASKSQKIEAKKSKEWICRWSKFYLKISEEISFISENMIFNVAVILDLISCDGVKWKIYKIKRLKLVFRAKE